MPITHFEIIELPSSNVVISLIGISPVVINTLYPIVLQNTLNFERHADLDGFLVKASIKWKAHNEPDGIISNESLMSLVWTPDDTGLLPISANADQTILNNEVIRLIDTLPINEATEFIIIENLEGVQNLKSKNSAVYKTQKILTRDLVDTEFTANSNGGGDPYFSLAYQVGKGEDIQPTVFRLNLKIDSLARITISNETLINYSDEFDVGGVPTIYNVKEQSFFLLIDMGYQNSLANIEIIINSPFLSLNIWNSVIIDNNGEEFQKFANETFNIDVDLDLEGKAILLIKNNIVEDTTAYNLGLITVTINDIDGDPLLVNPANNFVLLGTEFPELNAQLNFSKPKNTILMHTILTGKN